MLKLGAVIIAWTAAVISAQSEYNSGYRQPSYEEHPAKYDFRWDVRDDASYNNYGHQEQRDGHNADGYYYVQLPDSRIQTVKYYVNGDSGYVAEVNYQGEARYEQAAPSYQRPAYAPAPSYGGRQQSYEPAYHQPRPAYY